jgi:ABC-type transport system involved in cytochrome c biogenesis permease subunit
MRRLASILMWLVAFALIWPMVKPLTRGGDSPEAAIGQMPVLEGGRIKPFDAVARHNLLLLRGKQSIRTGEGKVSATSWLADLIFNRDTANDLPVFRIDHPDILGLLGLEAGTKKYFSYNDLQPYLSQIQQQARNVDPDHKKRNSYERAVYQAFGNLIQYQMLAQTVYPFGIRDSVTEFYASTATGILGMAERFSADGSSSVDNAPMALRIQLRQLEDMSQTPVHLLYRDGEWRTPGALMLEYTPRDGGIPAEISLLMQMSVARQSGNQESVAELASQLASLVPEITGASPGVEYYFNQSQPFIVALTLYVLVLLLVFLGWQFSPGMFLPTAYGILVAAFCIHTMGLVLRVVITGYAPVTNLYSSAVFTGWVAVVLSLLFEYFQRKGVGSLAAATVGFLTLLVAHHLADSGDTMEKMRAVLNSNFWLSTHVITIIMGYGATFLAGFLGLIYIVYGWLRRGLSKDMQQSFHRMIYGAICFSLLFSFVGTVLGGIWADQSWGRFWGWDPKENGALMIVLWTALVLHALRGGMIKTRGLVNLAIIGNVITAWSWFGTNMLGVGLHAYGFMDSAFFWLVMFWFSQFLIIAAEGLFPVRRREGSLA